MTSYRLGSVSCVWLMWVASSLLAADKPNILVLCSDQQHWQVMGEALSSKGRRRKVFRMTFACLGSDCCGSSTSATHTTTSLMVVLMTAQALLRSPLA